MGTRASKTANEAALLGIEPGDYLCSERDLYWVEHLAGDRAIIEDCRTGDLIDVSASDLERLQRLERPPAQAA